MSTYAKEIVAVDRVRETAARIGLPVCCLMAAMTVLSFGIAILTPPRSGPFCTGSCVVYPYTNTASYFPRDFLWMFPAVLLPPLFVLLCACVDFWVGVEKKVFSRIATAFATVAAAVISVDYFIQLAVIQPSLLRGEHEGLALFSQYNPHGLFIAMEEVGYLAMAAAFFFLGGALSEANRLEMLVRRVLMFSSLLGFAAFLALTIYFAMGLETRLELTLIAIDWTVLTITSVVLGIQFRRTLKLWAR